MEKFITINLQLFAEAPNPNVQTTSTNDLSPEMKTFYSKDLIEMLGANLVHLQFGDPVSLPKNGGKTIEWRRWSKFKKALTPLVEGVTPDGTPVEVGTVVAKIEQFGDYSTVADLLELTAIDNTIVEITAKHSENAQVTLDTVVRNKLVSGKNVICADRIIDGVAEKVSFRYELDENAKLTPDMIARAVAALKKANAPKFDGSYVAIIHPSVSYDLQRHPEFIDVNKYSAATKIFNGEIGKLYGARFVESTEACVFKGKNLSTENRNLTVKSVADNVITLTETITVEDAATLAGRSIVIKDISAESDTYEKVTVESATTTTITLTEATKLTLADGDILYPGEGGREGKAAYACLFLGKGAYKVVKLDANNVEVIVKGRGSAGTADPLSQRSTIGWKAIGFGAEIVIPEYIVRVECGSFYSDEDEAN